jgi:hypothetical protein
LAKRGRPNPKSGNKLSVPINYKEKSNERIKYTEVGSCKEAKPHACNCDSQEQVVQQTVGADPVGQKPTRWHPICGDEIP